MPFQNPPKVNASDLSSWTHSQQNYFWHPGNQQSDHPHMHLTGSTVSDVVTISNLSYTTHDSNPNINIAFDAETGYAHLPDTITYSQAYNIRIDDLNENLLSVQVTENSFAVF